MKRVNVEVEAVILIDDKTTKLKMVYREEWVKPRSENEELRTIEDLELAEIAEQEMEIIMNSIPDSRSFDIVTELIKRFRDKLTD